MDKNTLQNLFDNHPTKQEILIIMGLNPKSGGGYRTLNTYIEAWNIDLTLHNKLNTEYNKNQCRNLNLSRDINYYVKHNKKVDNGTLKKIILRDNLLTYKCAECTIESTYNGKPLTLQLDHIDGNNGNNELSNLRFLCPNCHSQTETFGARNKKRKKTKNERLSLRHQRNLQKYKNDIEKVKNSNIDFSKYGWVIKVANLLGRKHQKITKWMKIYMPEFYQDRCYK